MFESMTDAQLETELKACAAAEKKSVIRFLRLLTEFKRRRLDERSAFGDLFSYCRGELGLSDGDAYRRARVVKLALELPVVLDWIEQGRVHLSAIAVLQPHMHEENCLELLGRAERMTVRELEAFVVSLGPAKAPPRDVIRPLPPAPTSRPSEELCLSQSAPSRPAGCAIEEPPRPPAARISFNADGELLADLAKAQSLLSHQVQPGDLGPLFKRALKELLRRLDPAVGKIRPAKVLSGRRRVPQWIKRTVWRRDGGRCSYVDDKGRRCVRTRWLEYDHIEPFARGGRSDEPGNIRLLCRAHNQHAARQAFTTPA